MEYKNTLTTCIYCGCGCSFYLETLDGKITGVWPDKTHAISQGRLCIKGWNVASWVDHPDRLKTPLVRCDGKLVEASWDEAMEIIAARLKTIRAESGPDALGFLTSAKCTNEENYLLHKLARAVVNTNNIDHCARL